MDINIQSTPSSFSYGGMIGGFVVGFILAVIIYFAFIRGAKQACPEAGECPACPACPELKCPERGVEKECPLCAVCEDKECPACQEIEPTILGFPIQRGVLIVNELDNMENKLVPIFHKMICGLLHDPNLFSDFDKNKTTTCKIFTQHINNSFKDLIRSLENFRKDEYNPPFANYLYDNEVHKIIGIEVTAIRDNIIKELCPPGKSDLNIGEVIDKFYKIRDKICANVRPIPELKGKGFFDRKRYETKPT